MNTKLYIFRNYYSCISGLAKEVGRSPSGLDDKNLIFTEEKNTLITERELLRVTGGAFTTRVFSMKKFLKTLAESDTLSKEGSVMLCRRLITANADKLGCFAKTRLSSLAPSVYELIAQLKSAKVTPQDLESAAESSGGMLKAKLQDLSLLFAEYECETRDKFKDQSNYLSELPRLLSQTDAVKNANVFIASYASFTRQETDVIEALFQNAASVTAFFVAGENEGVYTSEAVYAYERAAARVGINVEKILVPGDRNDYITDRLFNPELFDDCRETDKIFMYEADDFTDEYEHIAEIISRDVRSGKLRYRDAEIAVGAKDGLTTLKRVFSEYGIPCFIDEKKVLSEHPLARLVISFIDVFRRGWARDDMLTFIKNPTFCFDRNFADAYENYVLAYGVNRAAFLRPFKYGTDNKDFAAFEQHRAFIAGLFDGLKKKDTAAGYVSAVKRLFVQTNALENTDKLRAALTQSGFLDDAAFTEQAADGVNAVLEETLAVLGDAVITAEEFRSVLSTGFAADEISVLPQYSDAVFVGAFKETRLASAKYLFMTGLTSSVPEIKSDVALLGDSDLDSLEKLKIIVEPKIKTVNRRERENVGLAAAAWTERLYLSYAKLGADGKAKTRSEIFDYFSAMFTYKGKPLALLNKTRKEALIEFAEPKVRRRMEAMRYVSQGQAIKRFARDICAYKEGIADDLTAAASYYGLAESKAAAEALLRDSDSGFAVRTEYGDLPLKNKKLSASLLEGYFTCPYKNFLDNGLGLSERGTGEAEPLDVGNFLHEVFEKYARLLSDGAIGSAEYGDAVVDNIVKDLLETEEYARFSEKAAGANLFERLAVEARSVCRRIYAQLADSEFEIIGTEAEFGNGKPFPAVRLPGKRAAYIEGKVDRVDASGEYVRIIDYKTGSVSNPDKNLFVGKKLQLYLYMNAFLDGRRPAGVYYFGTDPSYASSEKDEELTGHTVQDERVLAASDRNLDQVSGKSRIIGTEIKVNTATGERKFVGGNLLTEKELLGYVRYAGLLAAEGEEQMSEGVIKPSPYGDVCNYCTYVGFCAFCADPSAVPRSVASVTKETISDAAEQADTDEPINATEQADTDRPTKKEARDDT